MCACACGPAAHGCGLHLCISHRARLQAQLWNTLTLPHYDNGRERFVVLEPVGPTAVSSHAEKAYLDMEMLGYHQDTRRHHFKDKTLVEALGLEGVAAGFTQVCICVAT